MYRFLLLLPILLFAAPQIDIVIPCHKKDVVALKHCIEAARKYIQNVHAIYVVSSEKLSDKAEWIPETNYSFAKEDVAEKMYGVRDASKPRVGWIYQQFLKLYAKDAIPNLTDYYLVLDADVIFLHPMRFFTDDDVPLYGIGKEHYDAYFTHLDKVYPGLPVLYPEYSGICHHMVFKRNLLSSLIQEVEAIHNTPFMDVVITNLDMASPHTIAFSEYELYFSYVFHKGRGLIRPLYWGYIGNMGMRHKFQKKGYDFVCFPNWEV